MSEIFVCYITVPEVAAFNTCPSSALSRSVQRSAQSSTQGCPLRYWRIALLVLLSWCFSLDLFCAGTPALTITYVQGNYATPQTPQTTVRVTFTAAQVAGDLNVVVVGWNDSTTVVSAVTDALGNEYTLAVGPTIQSGYASQSIYYAKNIASAAARTNAITVTFASAAKSPDIRILEYSGADTSNPVDVTAANFGNSTTSKSGPATTTNATDLIFAANLVQTVSTGSGSGFTKRLLTTPDGDIAEDQMATAAGSYSATAPLSPPAPWIMQIVALRTPSGGTTPTTPTALSCNNASMTGSGTDACTVTLNVAATAGGLTVSLLSSSPAVTVPATVTVPANATNAGFTTTVSSVATAQAATLTASASSVSKTFALQLNAAVPTLTVASSNLTSTYDSAVTFLATISSGPSGTVTLYDGGASIGTGTINGTTATLTTNSLLVGSHTITANWAGNSNYAAVTSGAITQVVNKATPTITWTTQASISYGTALGSTQLDASSTVAGTFAYTPAAGSVLKAGSQTLSVTFTPTDTTDHSTATATVTLTVNVATPVISWTAPVAITYGTALSATQLNAASTVAGSFAYTLAAGTVLKAGAQTLSVTFTPTDITDYATATETVTLTVNAATPAITWAAPAAITHGAALSATQLDANSTLPGTFLYSPAVGTVLAAGSQTLSVTFTPTDTTDYTTATQTVTLSVNPISAFVQAVAGTTSGSADSLSLSFPANTFAGDLILVGFDFNASITPSSVTDSQGNTFTPVGTQLTSPAGGQSVVYYAKNIKGGADTVIVSISANATFLELYLTEYSGIDQTNPIDAQAGAAGSAGPVSSGNATTSVAGDVIYGYCVGDSACTAGSGSMVRSTFDENLIEDQSAGNPGSYAATGSASEGWTMHMVALKPASPGITVLAPAITSAASASGTVGSAFSYQITATNTPTSYGAAGLPAGLTMNSGTGLISGTPSAAATSTVTLSATNSSGTGNATLSLTIATAGPSLSINATSVGFGNVALDTLATQTVTLTSTGNASVTVSSATVTGTGFTLSGPTFPETLTPGQTATLGVQFDSTTTGAATGQMTIISNSATNGTTTIPLTGTGTAAAYSVDLNWDAPASSTDPVASYNVYRAPTSSSSYQLLNSSIDTQTTFVDNTVQTGQTYDYIVESVDSSGVESAPTSPVTVTIP